MQIKCTPDFISPILRMPHPSRRRLLQAVAALVATPATVISISASKAAAESVMVTPLRVAKDQPAVIFGGDILTMEGESPTYAEAVVIRDGMIIFVATNTRR